jgi:hypothetical protein
MNREESTQHLGRFMGLYRHLLKAFAQDGCQIPIGDAEFNESDHPRGQPKNAGQFVKGGGSGGQSPGKQTTIPGFQAKKESVEPVLVPVGGGKHMPGILVEDHFGVAIYEGVDHPRRKKGSGKGAPMHKKTEYIRNWLDSRHTQLPQEVMSTIKGICVWDTPNPDDAYWTREYHIPNFESAATAGAGRIHVWKSCPTEELALVLDHEHGHLIAHKFFSQFGGPDYPKEWRGFMVLSGWTSEYAHQSKRLGENFADSWAMYHSDNEELSLGFKKWHPQKAKFIKDFKEEMKGKGDA